MDADEAVVLGAWLYAANLSTIFRLRKFGMTDKVPFAITFKLEGADEQGADTVDEAKEQETGPRVLVPALRKIPTRRAIAYQNLTSDSFSIALQFDNSIGAVLPCCARHEDLGEFHVSGIHSVIAKYGHSGKVALHTVVDQSGLFSIDRADAAVEIEEEMKIKVPSSKPSNNTSTTGNSTKTEEEASEGKNTSSDGNAENATTSEGEKEGADGNTTAGAAGNTTDAATHTPAPGPAQEEIVKKWKRTARIPLNVTGGLNMPSLTSEQRIASRKVLRLLREREEAKRATAKARNDMEAYVIATREKLDSSETLQAMSTEEQRSEIKEALMDAEDWLYGDGDSATALELREKLRKVRKGGDAIEARAAEAAARPGAVKAGLDFVELVLKAANSWPTVKPWLNETEVAGVIANVNEFKEWIEKNVAEQAKRQPHEDLVFKISEISRKMDPVRKAFTRLNTKPKPIERKPVEVKIPQANTTTATNGTTIPESTGSDSSNTTTSSIPEEIVTEKKGGAEEKSADEGAEKVDATKEQESSEKKEGDPSAGHDEL